ncbi:VanZ family protein [bacterium]|nr:VanZ family protein [bacterium]
MKKLLYWVPAIFIGGLIFYLSIKPSSGESLFMHSDKVYHFIAYSVFGFCVMRGLACSCERIFDYLISFSVIIATFYGLGIEIFQGFLPYREASVADGFANLCGVLVGTWLYVKYNYKLLKRKRRCE